MNPLKSTFFITNFNNYKDAFKKLATISEASNRLSKKSFSSNFNKIYCISLVKRVISLS